MREIKFRALMKHVETGETRWIYYTTFQSVLNMEFSDGTPLRNSSYDFTDVKDLQYTGLKEIYESDVVKGERYDEATRTYKRFIGVVVYQAPSFVVNGVGKYEGIINQKLDHSYEKIGNI